MFVVVLTLSADFLTTIRALALELPQVGINTERVQELELRPEMTEAEARRFAARFESCGRYDKVAVIRR